MRCRINSTWVAGHIDYTAREWTPMQLSGDGASRGAVVITETGPGWASKFFCDGGNAGIRLGFETTREFASATAAFTAFTAYLSESPPHDIEGSVYLRMDEGGVSWSEAVLANSVLEIAGVVLVGERSLRIKYVLNGGLAAMASTGYYLHPYFSLSTDGNFVLLTLEGVPYAFPAEPLGTAVASREPVISGSYIVLKINGADYRLPAEPLGTNVVVGAPVIVGDFIHLNISGADYRLPLSV